MGNDIFTAVTLNKLLSRLLEHGIVVVATSNRPPNELNQKLLSGPQAAEFDSFLTHLSEMCEPWALNSGVDYRRQCFDGDANSGNRTFLHPLNSENEEAFDADFLAACEAAGDPSVQPCTIPVTFGRTLHVQRAAGGVAFFTFKELCDSPV